MSGSITAGNFNMCASWNWQCWILGCDLAKWGDNLIWVLCGYRNPKRKSLHVSVVDFDRFVDCVVPNFCLFLSVFLSFFTSTNLTPQCGISTSTFFFFFYTPRLLLSTCNYYYLNIQDAKCARKQPPPSSWDWKTLDPVQLPPHTQSKEQFSDEVDLSRVINTFGPARQQSCY